MLRYPPGTPYTECMATGKPVRDDQMTSDEACADRRVLAAPAGRQAAGRHLACCCSRWTRATRTLGFIVCTRTDGYRPFDAYDTEIGMEFASRAAIFIDNARRYSRERATALTLQRSLLPTGLPEPSSVEVRHRYLPGSKHEVGGDWYESSRCPARGWRWSSATWPATACGPRSPWAGCARRSRPWRCWSCPRRSRCSS